MNGEFEFL